MSEQSPPTTIVIFGASGDLTRRKLVPALFNLYRQNILPANYQIVGFASSKWGTDEFRRQMRSGIGEFTQEPFSPSEWESFAERLHYVSGSFTEASDYAALQSSLDQEAHRLAKFLD